MRCIKNFYAHYWLLLVAQKIKYGKNCMLKKEKGNNTMIRNNTSNDK